jgi:hypothetical protein
VTRKRYRFAMASLVAALISQSAEAYELATHARIINYAYAQADLGFDTDLMFGLGLAQWTVPTATPPRNQVSQEEGGRSTAPTPTSSKGQES